MAIAVSSKALTTLANLKSELSITSSDYDTRLEKIIDRVSAWIESDTGRNFKARHYNGFDANDESAFNTTGITSEDYIFFSGQDTVVNGSLGEFYLPQFPVQRSSVSGALAFELSYLSNRGSSGDTFTAYTENEDYVVDYDNGVVKLLAAKFLDGVKNYRIKCTAGFIENAAQPYVPYDLEMLCLELCKQVYQNTRMLQSESIGGWSRSYATSKEDPMLRDVFAQYTRIA